MPSSSFSNCARGVAVDSLRWRAAPFLKPIDKLDYFLPIETRETRDMTLPSRFIALWTAAALLSVPIATPAMGQRFFWDSSADGVGLSVPQQVRLRISVWDGLSISQCDLDVDVDNFLAPPTCTASGPPSCSRRPKPRSKAAATMLSLSTRARRCWGRRGRRGRRGLSVRPEGGTLERKGNQTGKGG